MRYRIIITKREKFSTSTRRSAILLETTRDNPKRFPEEFRRERFTSLLRRGFPILLGNPLESREIDSAYMGWRE